MCKGTHAKVVVMLAKKKQRNNKQQTKTCNPYPIDRDINLKFNTMFLRTTI